MIVEIGVCEGPDQGGLGKSCLCGRGLETSTETELGLCRGLSSVSFDKHR